MKNYDPELLKTYPITELEVIPIIYTNTTKVQISCLITIKPKEEDFWHFMFNECSIFDLVQEEFYQKSPYMLDVLANWDYDQGTLTFWARLLDDDSLKFIPNVEEYFKLLYEYNHFR